MTSSIPCQYRPGAALAGALLAPVAWLALSGAPAQAAEPASRVTRVTVYRGVALVERSGAGVQRFTADSRWANLFGVDAVFLLEK